MRITKTYWLLVLAVLMALLLPGSVSAQTEKKDMIIRFSPGSHPYEVKIGQDNIFYLEVENSGNVAINNISLSANNPEDWSVQINPMTIGSLSPGAIQTIDANVRPTSTASKGDYQVTVIAEGDGIRRAMTVYVRVQDSNSMWLWIGIGLGVIVIAGFVFVFLRMGRQETEKA